MGGSNMDDEWEVTSSCNDLRTLVLVGRTGNGKSATGNSIIGRRAFKSMLSSSGVTSTCELHSTVFNGQVINVIDTPGLFDVSAGTHVVCKEIVKCIKLAGDGIHAILLVSLKIMNYMIVVFTGGDELEEGGTLKDYFGHECPRALKEILDICDSRMVLFDNKTTDNTKRFDQRQELLKPVDMVNKQNDGIPFTDELLTAMKLGNSVEDQMKLMLEMVEVRLRELTLTLEEKLLEEKAARMKAEENALEAKKKWNDEIFNLRERLEMAQNCREKHDLEAQKKLNDEIIGLRERLGIAQNWREAHHRQCTIL